MANRGLMLALTVGGVLGLAACGRASDEQINQLLGITPTPTPSAEQLAEATAQASATVAARAAALASPASGGAAAALGDVVAGRRLFTTWCAGCHGPGGSGPAILEAGSPGASVTTDTLLPLVREAEGHPSPPGTYPTTQISDRQVSDLVAYIRDEAGGGAEPAGGGGAAEVSTPVAETAALGDAVAGRRQFATWCAGCHGPGGSGPAILEPGGPGASVSAADLLPLVRDAEGHPSPPGPYKTTEISDAQIEDLAAYIREEASGE